MDHATTIANALLTLSLCARSKGFREVADDLLALVEKLPLEPNTCLSQRPRQPDPEPMPPRRRKVVNKPTRV